MRRSRKRNDKMKSALKLKKKKEELKRSNMLKSNCPLI